MTSGSDFETNSGWAVEFHTGSAQKLHDTEPDFSRRLVRVNEISAPALVLGSTQSNDLIDHRAAAAAGVEIAQRRSGGGVVSMRPGSQCWVDVFIPATDSLWVDDVMLSSSWLGRCWADVATTYGWTAPKVHAGGVSNRRLSRLVCFAALGPGEVSQNSKKLVGISQRRTRHGAKFQCIAYIEWDPSLILDLLQLGSDLEELNQVLVGEVA
ncbi:MAG TPA: hypothetical protein VL068_02325, partial [Microthrixaceae bacterium]|nr:hypothetical protein [Microthrixaceae bacterium]